MIPMQKNDGEDKYSSFKFGLLNIGGSEYNVFIKCPDKDPKFFLTSENKDVCISLTEPKYLDEGGANDRFSDEELKEVVDFLGKKHFYYEDKSVWKVMYTLWNTENLDITMAEVSTIEMPDYSLLNGGKKND